MAGLADTDTVDLIAESPDGQEITLHMVHNEPWRDDPELLEQLKQKFNSYVAALTNGTLADQVPRLEDRTVRIVLDCIDTPTEQVADLLSFTVPQLDRFGIGLLVNVRAS